MYKRISVLLSLLSLGLFSSAYSQPTDQPTELDGKAFRLVWAQDQKDSRDVYGVVSQSALMKFDSTVGKEEVLVSTESSYGNPTLSPDGEWVIWSDRVLNKIFKIPFAGGERKEVATGFAAEVWRDPKTGEDTVFVANDPEGYIGLPAWGRIERTPLHREAPLEKFWDGTRTMANNFQLSKDGKVASGQFPWPLGGIAVMEKQRWFPLDRGCWPSLAPDNSYIFWQFDGVHKNIVLQDPVTRKEWVVNLNGAPGIHGFEVYHPRWSNHPRYMVFTGPYREGRGGNRIIGGGPAVEVFIGTFASDFSRMESFRQITQNETADFFPDLWVEGGGEVISELPQRTEFKAQSGADYSLYFGWKNAKADNRGPDGRSLKEFVLYDKAYLGPNHELVLRGRGGHANPMGDHFALRETVGRTQGFSFEGVFTTSKQIQTGRMFGYTQRSGHGNVYFEQQGEQVFVYMNVVGEPVRFPVGKIKLGEPLHLVVTVKDTTCHAWLNGKLFEKELLGRPFWGQGSLIWGEQQGYGLPWEGSVSHIRLITRQLQPDEVKERYAKIQKELANRLVPKQARVRAKLLETSSVSTPEKIAPYINNLSAGEFEVVEVLSGEFEPKRFAGYSFSILNRKLNPDHPAKLGDIYTLDLEAFDEQPQLRSELKSNDLEDIDLPAYLVLP